MKPLCSGQLVWDRHLIQENSGSWQNLLDWIPQVDIPRREKMLKRLTWVLTLVVGLVLVITACQAVPAPGQEPAAVSAPAEKSKAEPAEEVVTLKFWNGFNAFEVDALNKMVEEYWVPTHPNIKIDATGEQSPESILTAISGGDPPDVAILWGPEPVPLWARQGAIMDLTPFIEASNVDLEAELVPAGLDWTQYEGKYYGLPFVNFNWGFYWNKALFREAGLDPDKPPTTIDELEEYAHKLTIVDDAGNITQLGWMPASQSYSIDLAMAFGGKFYDSETGAVTANDPNIVKALEWDLNLAQSYGLDKVNAFTSGFSTGDNPFFLGKVAMTIDGCWNVAFIKEYAPDIEYGAASVPAVDPAYARSGNVGTNPIVIPNGIEHVDEAWEFALFLSTNPDVSRNFANLVSNIPQVKAAMADFSDDPNTQFFAELSNSPNARAWAPLPVVTLYDTEWTTAIEKIFTGQATPQEALDVVQKTVEAEQLER
jgi:multiple sugar transport system substrate-binding protein